MPLTIEERERLAYIAGSPVHVLLAAMVDEEHIFREESDHEIRQLKEEVAEKQATVDHVRGVQAELYAALEDAKRGQPKPPDLKLLDALCGPLP